VARFDDKEVRKLNYIFDRVDPDLILDSGGVINWNSSDVTITHSSNALAFAGASSGYTFTGPVIVGVDDTGHDVKFFGATASKYMLWDESADSLIVVGTVDATTFEFDNLSGTGSVSVTNIVDEDNMASDSATLLCTQQSIKKYVDDQIDTADTLAEVLAIGNTSGGTDVVLSTTDEVQFRDNALKIYSSADGQLDIDADTEVEITTTTLDINGAVDISGATQISNTVTVGVDDTGYDVTLFGASTGKSLLWDQSEDTLIVTGTTTLVGTTNLDATDIDGNVQIDGTVTVGVNDTGKDVKFFGATASMSCLWDESADSLLIASSAATALSVGLNGATNPAFNVDASTGSSATGINIASAAATAGVALSVLSSGTNENLTVDAKGSGTITLAGTSTGAITLTRATTMSNALTYGGVTLSNAVTGTGNMVLSAGPTFSGSPALSTPTATSLALGGATIGSHNIAVTGTSLFTGAVSVGVDDTGHDVTFFGATTGKSLVWDQSEDTLTVTGTTTLVGTTNLDAVDIDGNVQVDGTITVGVDGTGKDVKFFGDTSGAYIEWDESADKLLTAGGALVDIVKDKLLIGGTAVTTTAAELNFNDTASAGTVVASKTVVVDGNKDIASFRNITLTGVLDSGSLDISGDADIAGTTNLDAVDIDGNVQLDGTLSVGVNDTGKDVKFFGATSGKYMLWDESDDTLIVTGVSSFDGKTTINEAGADADFRVESNSQQFALYVNGGVNHVAVGYNAEPTVTNLGIAVLSAGAGGGVLLVKEDGSQPSSGEGLGSFGMRGEDSANNLFASSAMISAYASENHSGSAAGANMRFYTKPNGVGPGSSPSERMRITQAGEVMIAGSSDQGAYNLQCNGTGVWGQGAYVNGSDERLKENIADLNDASKVVANLRPVTFSYKSNYSKDTSIQPGFIAQELQQALAGKIYAEGIVKGEKYLSVAYQTLIPILTKSLQEALGEIDELKARVSAVEKGNS